MSRRRVETGVSPNRRRSNGKETEPQLAGAGKLRSLRDDFPLHVKEELAKRVSCKCSNPGCRQATSGPQSTPCGTVNIGVAAHLTAAAPGGPRYDFSLSAEQRSSSSNGIWLCQNCACLIDRDPNRYTVEKLRGWKSEAEAEAARGLEHHPAPAGQAAAELLVEFADVEREDALGSNISWAAEFCEMPEWETIPDLLPPRQRNPFGIDLSAVLPDPMNRPNIDFFRELSIFLFARRLFRPIRLVVSNVGRVAAGNVRVELSIPTDIGAMVVDECEIPDPPSRRVDLLSKSVSKGIKLAFRFYPGHVSIDKNDERFRIAIECGTLQPGRRVWSDVLYIGKGETGDLSLCGLVLADNLSQPKTFVLTMAISITETRMTVDELCSLHELATLAE